jgi:hypothetical protein
MRPDHERLRALLTDTITCLCRNGLQFEQNICVQGLLGITLDNSEVFIVHINETMTCGETGAVQEKPLHVPFKSHHMKPTKRLFARETYKFAKRYSGRALQPSRISSSMLNESSSEPAASNLPECIEDAVNSNEEQSDRWKIHADDNVSQTIAQATEEPIEIKSEPDAEAANFEHLSEFDAENNDNDDNKLDTRDIFHSGAVDSHIPRVSNQLSNKHIHQFSINPHFNNGSPVSLRTSQHSYPIGYVGDNYETGHTSSWSSGLQPVAAVSHSQVSRS